MIIADYKSLGIADIIMDRKRAKKIPYRTKGKSGLWGKKCASAKELDRSLARVKR